MKFIYQFFALVGLLTLGWSVQASTETGTSSTSSQQGKLTVSAVSLTDIKANQARCSFTIQGSPISEKGVCFSEGPAPTISGKKSMSPGNPTNSGTSIISGLKANTTYYVRAYAKSGNEVFYGSELNFTTTSQEQTKGTNQNTGKKVEPKTGGSK